MGAYSETNGLAAARVAAHQQRALLLAGKDPKTERQKAQAARQAETRGAVTFKQVAKDFLADPVNRATLDRRAKKAKAKAGKAGGSVHQWEQTLSEYVHPKIGAKRIGDVNRRDVLDVLEPIWHTKSVTASRIRGRIERILDWAAIRELRSGENPARLRLLGLPSLRALKRDSHFAAIPPEQFAAFMKALRAREGLSPRALEFGCLTMARPGEVLSMRWNEVDPTTKTWTIPAEKMKAGVAHRVPLSPAAFALLKKLPTFAGFDSKALVFSLGAKEMSENTLGAVIKRMHAAEVAAGRRGWIDPTQHTADGTPKVATAHGTMRSTTSDLLGSVAGGSWPSDLLDRVLSHVEKSKSKKAYQRSDKLAERRPVMARLAELAAGKK